MRGMQGLRKMPYFMLKRLSDKGHVFTLTNDGYFTRTTKNLDNTKGPYYTDLSDMEITKMFPSIIGKELTDVRTSKSES